MQRQCKVCNTANTLAAISNYTSGLKQLLGQDDS
jgi:hypothetical protein